MRNTSKPRRSFSTVDGRLVPLAVLAGASLVGGLMVAVTLAGRTAPASASALWIATLLGASGLLAGWGLLFARCFHRRAGMPLARALFLAALCHLPLLAGLGLVWILYTDDVANHIYSTSAYGRVVYRPLALGALVAAPALLQTTVALVIARRRVAPLLLVAVPVAAGLVLRLWGVDWQLPFQFHDDERLYVISAMMAWAHGDPNPHRFVNPSVVFYIDVALFNLLGGAHFETFRVLAEAFGRQVSDPKGMYLVVLASRIVMALFGTSTVALVYLSARELFDRRTAFFAGLFMAVSFLHVRNSHYGTNDVLAVFFTTASFLFAAKLYRSGRPGHYLWAGFLGGLATSTKYSAGLFILPILAAHLARRDAGNLRSRLLSAGVVPLLAAYALSGVGFVLGTPYSVLDWDAFNSAFRAQYGYGAAPWFAQDRLPTWWMHLAALVQGFGLVPLVLAVVGALSLWQRRFRELAIVAVLPIAYYIFMSRQQLFFARFAIPFLPFLALLAGHGMAQLLDRLRSLSVGRWLVPVALVVGFAQPIVYSVQSDLLMAREDTRVLADRWVSANLPENAVLLVDTFAAMRSSQGWPSRPDLQVRSFDPTKDPTPWRRETQRPILLVTSSFGWEGVRRGLPETVALGDPYREIKEEGRLVASFAEGRHGQEVPYSLDDTYTPFWYPLERERIGPMITIYQFDD